MRIAFLDCFSGISGDMFLGAAVDAGVSFEELQPIVRSLGLKAELRMERVARGGLAACRVHVLIDGHSEQPGDGSHQHGSEHSHPHEGEHTHAHEQAHEHPHAHGEAHAHPLQHAHPHRGLPEIRKIIDAAPVSEAARAFALRAFTMLAEAEGKVHNRPAEGIHFHEVGSEDAIVDILCAGVAAEKVGAVRWYASALNVGSGTVRCAHGTLPVPAPAVVELLKGAPIYSSGAPRELLTPTGAAILRALDVCYEPLPPMRASSVGYGAGGRELPGQANVLRITVGESAEAARGDGAPAWRSGTTAELSWDCRSDTITVLEANLDDMNPQLVGYVLQKLLDRGALDVFCTAVQMKKGRPGMVLTVLSTPELAEEMARLLLTESTTLGVRIRQQERRILERRFVQVASPWGEIAVKLGCLPSGEVVNCAPEFEDCRRIAEAHCVPLKNVLQEALRLYLEQRERLARGGEA
jgi:hypothetical protein